MGLPMNSDLRKSLIMKPAWGMHQLMDRVEEHKRVEDDQSQGNGKAKVFMLEQRDPRPNRFGPNKLRKEFFNQAPQNNAHAVNSLAKARKLKQFRHQPSRRGEQLGSSLQRDLTPPLPLGTINIIFATPRREVGTSSRVMAISPQLIAREVRKKSKWSKSKDKPILGFSETDKVGTFQPHDDALVVTLQIGGFKVKRIMVDQGSGIEIMYPHLYKGPGLKPEDLSKYDIFLVGFDEKTVTPIGMIRLPM
ncbi:uncharacterized protein LOC112024385 [Quercus suber]|uniref:uncharacterized protein LOC112024385 n=1 Tax=Quercus suber TaxID=58331 RepID=UPI000CE26A1D|nr:uncharacterized protein LOC112024385 [Quercus suber]